MNTELPRSVASTCPYCGVGCGVNARVSPPAAVGGLPVVQITGDKQHPANFGRLCSKGSALAETIGPEDRLTEPSVNQQPTSWDQALELVAEKFSQTIAETGPDSVAFYVSGQLLTEDYYVANKLMKGFIGSANIDTNSRLCMASSVAGHRRAFGADIVPGCYEDLEIADLIVLVGSNLAWCHPVLFQRIQAARRARPELKLVVIDPRRTVTADEADLHLPISADADAPLFNYLLASLAKNAVVNSDYVGQHTDGFDQALSAAQRLSAEQVAEAAGISVPTLDQFVQMWSDTEKVVTVYSQGINQSSIGTDKVNAIINCHLATGRIGLPGAGPFSVTGQPNAMGGREVGGLANALAAHLDPESAEDRDLLQDFWDSPGVAQKTGAKAVDLFDRLATGEIRAVWIMATNPADSLPDSDRVQAALAKCPFVVVSDVVQNTDTLRYADVVLPSSAWGEKSGTVTNSERMISRQRAFLEPPGQAKPDWWQMAQVAIRMGWKDQFAWSDVHQVFVEYAALTSTRNDGRRGLDIGAMVSLTADQYEQLTPTRWPATEAAKRAGTEDPTRFFANGEFLTPNSRARFVAVHAEQPQRISDQRPLVLNTGRIRDQWHTMTRTGRSARLSAHRAEPFIELHPVDAVARGIVDAQLVQVESDTGRCLLRALITDRQQPGAVFSAMHWTDQLASHGRSNALVPARTDPNSGQPAFKHVAVAVSPARLAAYGYLLSAAQPRPGQASYWAKSRVSDGWQVELGFDEFPADPANWLEPILDLPESAQMLSLADNSRHQVRLAWFDGDRLCALLLLSDAPVLGARTWLASLLNQPAENRLSRFKVLAGIAGADQPDPGPTVCACFGVGATQIGEVIAGEPGIDVDGIGKALKAGTNCGSCRGEIAALVRESQNVPQTV